MRALAARWLFTSLFLGCSGARVERQEERALPAHGAVVARVDGAPIGLDDVSALSARTGLSPRDALLRLEDERLLAHEAAVRGYAGSSAVAQDTRRALVQVLLAQAVERFRPEAVPLSEVRARFELAAPRLNLAPDSFPAHEAAIREQLALEQQKRALDKLLAELRESIPVQLDEAKVQKLLSDPALWGGSS